MKEINRKVLQIEEKLEEKATILELQTLKKTLTTYSFIIISFRTIFKLDRMCKILQEDDDEEGNQESIIIVYF